MLDKKVYFLCLDYIMFVYLIDTVHGIIHILRLHILFKNLLDFSRLRKVQSLFCNCCVNVISSYKTHWLLPLYA